MTTLARLAPPPARAGLLGRPGLAAILLAALALRLARIGHSGFTTPYYAAAVRSMADGIGGGDWHNFLYAAFDPAGFLAVDKPPVALWLQVASVRLLGLSDVALHLPQALLGVAGVALLYHLVRRRFGVGAGLLAALFLALTPIDVAVDRSNNTDSALVLVMLLAAWPLSLAAERGRLGLLLLAAAILGMGFNVKMLAAMVVVPGFIAVTWFGAPICWRRRVLHLAAAAVVLGGVSLSWPLFVDATPPDQRPYVDSTRDNSVLELAIGHNAMDRFVRPAWRRAWPREAGPPGGRQVGPGAGADALARPIGGVPAGVFRLADPLLASQVGWLVPLAVAALVFAFGLPHRPRLNHATLLPGRLLPLDPARQAILLWGLWLIIPSIVYSAAGGIFQPYYLAPLGPPVAALSAIAVMRLRTIARVVAALLVTASWQAAIVWGSLPAENPLMWLGLVPLVAAVAACAWVMVRPRGARPALAVAVTALLIAPAAWTAGTLLAPVPGTTPIAHLLQRGRFTTEVARRAGTLEADPLLIPFLTAHRGDARYLLATQSARQAAPIILRTGAPVLALGGFLGSIPILTGADIAQLAASGQLRYVLARAERGGAGRARSAEGWVRENGRAVPPALWRTIAPPEDPPRGRPGLDDPSRMTLYDIAPPLAADQ